MSDRLEQLKQLHAADPDDPFLTYGIAMELSKAGEYIQAIDWFDQTLARDPRYHYAYYQKGIALDALDRHDEAKSVLSAGIEQARSAGDAKAEGELQELLASMT